MSRGPGKVFLDYIVKVGGVSFLYAIYLPNGEEGGRCRIGNDRYQFSPLFYQEDSQYDRCKDKPRRFGDRKGAHDGTYPYIMEEILFIIIDRIKAVAEKNGHDAVNSQAVDHLEHDKIWQDDAAGYGTDIKGQIFFPLFEKRHKGRKYQAVIDHEHGRLRETAHYLKDKIVYKLDPPHVILVFGTGKGPVWSPVDNVHVLSIYGPVVKVVPVVYRNMHI